jgi:outer membrane protein assembly factor BamB
MLCGLPAGAAERAPILEAPIEDHPHILLSAIAAKGGLVFVSGAEEPPEGSEYERSLIVALDQASGAQAWLAQGDAATANNGGADGESTLSDLALSEGVVVAGGFREVPDATEGAVRAYDQRSGTLLWNERIPEGFLTEVAAIGDVAYAATTIGTFGEPEKSILLRAYDLFTGEPLWEQVYGVGNPFLGALAAGGRNVAVVGYHLAGEDPADYDAVVRVYDAQTGELRFDDVYDEAGLVDVAYAAAIHGRRLFVGGAQTPEGGDADDLVIAYDLEEGTRLWSRSTAEQGGQYVDELVASGRSVFARSPRNPDFLVRSYRAKNGQVQWDTPVDVGNSGPSHTFAVKGRRAVFGTGGGVVALDTRDGSVVWDSPAVGISAVIRGKTAFLSGYGQAFAFPVR